MVTIGTLSWKVKVEGIPEFNERLQKLEDKFKAMQDRVKDVEGTLDDYEEKMEDVNNQTQESRFQIDSLANKLSFLISPLKKIMGFGLSDLFGGLNSGPLKRAGGLVDSILQGLGVGGGMGLAKKLKNGITKALRKGGGLAKKGGSLLSSALAGGGFALADEAARKGKPLLSKAGRLAKKGGGKVKGKAGGLISRWLGPLLGGAAIGSGSTITGVLSGLLFGGTATMGGAGAVGASIGLGGVKIMDMLGINDAIKQGGKETGRKLHGWIRDGLISAAGATGFSQLGGFATGLVDNIGKNIEKRGVWNGFWKSFDEGLKRAKKATSQWIASLKRNWNRIAGLIDKVLSKLSDVKKGVMDIGGTAKEKTFGAGAGIVEGIQGAARGILGMEEAASGGYVQKTGMAKIHKGEAIVPPNKTKNFQNSIMGNQNVTVNIDAGMDISNISRSQLRKLAEMVSEEMGQTARRI